MQYVYAPHRSGIELAFPFKPLLLVLCRPWLRPAGSYLPGDYEQQVSMIELGESPSIYLGAEVVSERTSERSMGGGHARE